MGGGGFKFTVQGRGVMLLRGLGLVLRELKGMIGLGNLQCTPLLNYRQVNPNERTYEPGPSAFK